ncbi:MAG: peptide deformylase [Anaerolineae bacterium]|nr:peptide deformylase [Anaerolineae bacterium]
MTIRAIITPQNPVLREKARKVTAFDDPQLQTLIDDMVETMVAAVGVGLAAPQVAVSQRVIVVQLPDDEHSKEEYGEAAGELYIVVNPEIIRSSRELTEGVEACLSIPGYYGNVLRHVAVTVRGQNRHGKDLRIKARDWLARVFQHEIDHLDGELFIDKATQLWRQMSPEGDGDGAAPAPQDDPLAGMVEDVPDDADSGDVV